MEWHQAQAVQYQQLIPKDGVHATKPKTLEIPKVQIHQQSVKQTKKIKIAKKYYVFIFFKIPNLIHLNNTY